MTKFIRKLTAKIRGTFVAECPKCHKHFYGADGFHVSVKIDHKYYRYVCDKCLKGHKKV